jgi:diketogulonate reductase-like aldo/keto reductase
MKYKEFGRSGFKTSVIGMGTYFDPLWISLAMIFKIQKGKKQKINALKTGIDHGINFIDTAEIYQSETLVRDAIKGVKRDELFLASKIWPNHLSPDKVEKACKRSLTKLGIQYLDLYQIHFPSSRTPISETMRAMEKLIDVGLIRNVGISNFSFSGMLEAEHAMKRHELCSTQMNYNMLHRDVEKEILPHCERERIAMIAYYPLAHGKLAQASQDAAIGKICEQRKVSRAQLALAWLVARSEVNFPIPRASRPNHVDEDSAAGDLCLSSEEMKTLE